MRVDHHIYVVADDLTGAAEIAGVAHRQGRTAAIVFDPAHMPADIDTIVYDTDTRLQSPEAAAARVRLLALGLKIVGATARTFKKTDSVLRGNVRAEIETLARALDRPRVLLVPANPSAGRTIREGIYRIHDVALAETEFARDPYHPARSSNARDLLGTGSMPVTLGATHAALPAEGIFVGDAASPADMARWATRVDATTLPAGGRDFFEAWLQIQSRPAAPSPPTSPTNARGQHNIPALAATPPVLVITGSMSDAARDSIAAARQANVPVLAVPDEDTELARWIDHVHEALATRGLAFAVVDRALEPGPGAGQRFSRAFAKLTQELFTRASFKHLILEGGATAAAVLHALPVPALRVTGEWAPGVVGLAGDRLAVTMKPGSYPWPETLTRFLRG